MLLDDQTLKRSIEIHPEVVEFFTNNPSPPLDWSDVPVIRAVLNATTEQSLARIGKPDSTITETYRDIEMRDGYKSSLKIQHPTKTPSTGSPLIVLCFGGGFISGNNDQLTEIGRCLVGLFGAVVVSLSYRLAPEHKFPKAWEDIWDSTGWIAANAYELAADPTKGFIIGGVSAGALGTAFVTCESQITKLAHPITGQWLCVPPLMNANNVPKEYKTYYQSAEQNKYNPVLPASSYAAVNRLLELDEDSPLAMPILYDVPLSGLPPTYLQADGLDLLRDDALIYHELLLKAGTKAKIDLYPGCPHAHLLLMPELEVSKKAAADVLINFGWLLGKNITEADARKVMAHPVQE